MMPSELFTKTIVQYQEWISDNVVREHFSTLQNCLDRKDANWVWRTSGRFETKIVDFLIRQSKLFMMVHIPKQVSTDPCFLERVADEIAKYLSPYVSRGILTTPDNRIQQSEQYIKTALWDNNAPIQSMLSRQAANRAARAAGQAEYTRYKKELATKKYQQNKKQHDYIVGTFISLSHQK